MSLQDTVTQDTGLIRPCQKFEGHTRWVSGVIHIPGGQRIVTCSSDGSLRVWGLQSGRQIEDDWRDGERAVNAIALSPDGKKVASGSLDGTVRLWNMATGKVITKWTGHARGVTSVCWSRDAERVVSGSYDGTARVWDVESRKTVLEIETGLSGVGAAIYSPDATMIATGGGSEENEFKIKIWDANTGKLITNLKGHTWSVYCLAWSMDERTLISGSYDSIRTWNTTTWQEITVLTGHTSFVEAIAISPNGRVLASASLDRTARLWNLENGQPIGSPLQHADPVNCVSFSTDGKLLATGCRDRNAYSWDVSAVIREADINGHPNPSRIHPISVRHDTTPRPRFLEWVRRPFFNWLRRRNGGIELPVAADVSSGQGDLRDYSTRDVRVKKEKKKVRDTKNAKNAKNASTSSIAQQSAGAAQAQPYSEPHAAATIPSTTPVTATTFTRTMHSTRFWPTACCASAQNIDGHH